MCVLGKCTNRPRRFKLKDVMDLLISNDSDFGESDFDDEDSVEDSGSLNGDDSESDSEDNEPLAKLVTVPIPAQKVLKKVYV